jgi:CRP-like cAMP-binding protein
MSHAIQSAPKNKILAALPPDEYDSLAPHLTPVSLALGQTIYEPESHITSVYFVSCGVVSYVTHLVDGGSIEVGLVGNDGMVGMPLIFGDDISPNHAFVQIADGAVRLDAATFLVHLESGGQLKPLLLRFALAMNKQVAQTAACNGSHKLSDRLARWLLMCHDRVDGDEIRLTQEFIAEMLGTRRSGVSEAAIALQSANLIRYSRGHITVLDRHGLEAASCECYRVVKAESDRLLP